MQNLRALASKVVSACREKGLKQSVVMDVLAKSSGYRSIQCAESKEQSDKIASLEERIVLRTLLYQSDFDYTLDLHITLFDVASHDQINAGDPVFEWMWSLTELGFIKMMMKLIAINSKFGIIHEYISKQDVERRSVLKILNNALPEKLVNYIEVESVEGGRVMLDVMLQDIATPVYNAIYCLLEFNKKQNIFLKRDELMTIQDAELDVNVIVNDSGNVLATYTPIGFEVSGSSMWSQKAWIDDPLKKGGVNYTGEPSPNSKAKFITAIMVNGSGKVKSDFAKFLTANY